MKRALVVSGGGSKGAFAVGVIKKLKNLYPYLQFDIYVGTSAGSLVVTFASIQQYDLLEEVYTTVKTTDIFTKLNVVDRINEHSLYDITPAWNLINKYYADEKYGQLQQLGKKVFIATTCLQDSQLTVFTNDEQSIKPAGYKVTRLVNADHYRKALLASMCEPVFMPPVKVNLHVPGATNPDYQFSDGGVTKNVGIQMAVDAGASEIFTIVLSPEKDEPLNTEFKSLFPILQQTLDILTTDVGKNDLLVPQQYNQALEYISMVKDKMIASGVSQTQVDEYFNTGPATNPFAGKLPVKIFIIRPAESIGGGPGGLTFDPAEMKQMLVKGEEAVDNFIASFDPSDITWV